MQTLDLRNVLGDIPWAVVGGVATRMYMAERATLDLDILIRPRDSATVKAKLERAGFEFQQPLLITRTAWKSPDGQMLDVFELADAWVDEALMSLARDPQGLPVLKLPYLVLMKLQPSRTQDLADVTRMLGGATEDELEDVRNTVATFLNESSSDLESLIQLGKLERQNSRRTR